MPRTKPAPTPFLDARQLKAAAKLLRTHGYVVFARNVSEIADVIERRARAADAGVVA